MTGAAHLCEIVAVQRVVQPLTRGARIGKQLILEVRCRSDGIDVLALDHESLVDVARRAPVCEPDDPRVHHGREHESHLEVKPAPDERWRGQGCVQDQPARRLRTRALHSERHRSPETQARNIELVRTDIGGGRQHCSRQCRCGVTAGERRGTTEAREIRRDDGAASEQHVEPVREVLCRTDETVTEQERWAGAAGEIAQRSAFVLREPLGEFVHAGRHSVSICARCRRPL